MRVEVTDKPLSEVESDFVGVLVFDGDELPEPLAGAPGSEDVKASYKKATLVHPGTPRRALVVGLGARDEFTPERARVAAAIAARTAASMDASTLALKAPDGDDPAAATAMVEGAILASYRFDRFKSKGDDEDEDPKGLEEVTVIGDGGLAEAVEAARIGAEAENFARELQDLPSNVVTPSYLAGRAKAIAEEHDSVTFEVLGREQIREKGMGGLVAVSQGTAEEPQLIVLRYQGGGDETLGLVGKGVTFDSGGISIKPSAGMQEMKMDMSGAAAVLETVSALAKLELPIDVLAVIPSTENMPSGTAVKPGDIITQLNGKTVEVNNTDAEGRLILADALAYAVELGADRIVDLATLTGAVVVALGSTYAGLISNDDAFADRGRGGRHPNRGARLASAPPPRVQGAHQGHGRGPHQRFVEAEGVHDLRRVVPGGVRGWQAVGPPRHRRHRLGRRPRVRRQGPDRVRRRGCSSTLRAPSAAR